jgi:hypothetical protein
VRVLVDAVQESAAITGIDRVVTETLRRLPDLMPDVEFVIGVSPVHRLVKDAVSGYPNVTIFPAPLSPSRKIWLCATLPALTLRLRPNVVLGLHNCSLPPVSYGKSVATVHDLIPFRLADTYDPRPKPTCDRCPPRR